MAATSLQHQHTRRRPRQRRSQEIVSAILEAGRQLLEAEGAEAVTTNRIADRAGVSIGSVYRYFPNKEAVIASLYDSAAEVEVLMRRFLAHHEEAVQVRDVEQAAFLVARGVSAVLRLALDERPEKLAEAAFRDELVDLLVSYVSAPR